MAEFTVEAVKRDHTAFKSSKGDWIECSEAVGKFLRRGNSYEGALKRDKKGKIRLDGRANPVGGGKQSFSKGGFNKGGGSFTNTSIERQCAIKSAVELANTLPVTAKTDMTERADLVVEIASKFYSFIANESPKKEEKEEEVEEDLVDEEEEEDDEFDDDIPY